jgi:hypothetical protein
MQLRPAIFAYFIESLGLTYGKVGVDRQTLPFSPTLTRINFPGAIFHGLLVDKDRIDYFTTIFDEKSRHAHST